MEAKKERPDAASEVYSWGQGLMGQLGHADEVSHKLPRLVVSFLAVNVKQVSCGNQHTAVLLGLAFRLKIFVEIFQIAESGEVYTFGRGNFGQLGLGPMAGAKVSQPTLVATLVGKAVMQVACGWHHTAALVSKDFSPLCQSSKRDR